MIKPMKNIVKHFSLFVVYTVLTIVLALTLFMGKRLYITLDLPRLPPLEKLEVTEHLWINEEFTLSEIFDFEFDYVIVKQTGTRPTFGFDGYEYGKTDGFAQSLNSDEQYYFKYSIDPSSTLLFFKDEELVYIHVESMYKTYFQEGMMIEKDEELTWEISSDDLWVVEKSS